MFSSLGIAVSFLRRRRCTIRSEIAKATLLSFLSQASIDAQNHKGNGSKSAFDLLCLPEDFDARSLTRSELFLDSAAIARHYATVRRPLGAIDPRWGIRFSLNITQRIVRRLARRAAHAAGLDPRLLEKAWFFALWSELCVLVPARHLARHLARVANGELIVIPIASTTFHYLGHWHANAVEPLYLAYELRRRGAHVVLCAAEAVAVSKTPLGTKVTFEFKPHPGCWQKALRTAPETLPQSRSAVVLSGIRSYTQLLAEQPGALKIESPFAPVGVAYDLGLLSERQVPLSMRMSLLPRKMAGAPEALSIFAAPSSKVDLVQQIVACLSSPTQAALSRTLEVIDRYGLDEAHVCDHLFFESAITAYAMRARGGKVILWPHSSNAGNPLMYDEGDVDAIRCTTRSAARAWAARLPKTPCRVQPELIPQPCKEPRSLKSGAPVTVVVFAGAHALSRMPILDRRRHEESYRKLFARLADLRPGVRTIFKAKTIWEPVEWLRDLLGPDIPLEETTLPPLQLDQPNMIFLTVSFGSTALLEGLSRGISCMIVREFPLEDYTGLDPAHIPIGSVDDIIAKIIACRDLKTLDALTRQELAWYVTETACESP